VPIVAFAAAAIPETLGGAGVLIASKAPADLAAAIAVVAHDDGHRRALTAAGTRRLGDFAERR
jgi:glycosyltransferase involved in cell wall biosynthesis